MEDREWMYSGWSRTQAPSNDWIQNTNQFLDHAFSMPNLVEDGNIKCPCAVCHNCVRHKRFTAFGNFHIFINCCCHTTLM